MSGIFPLGSFINVLQFDLCLSVFVHFLGLLTTTGDFLPEYDCVNLAEKNS